MRPSLARDNRAIAWGIVVYVGSIIIGTLLFLLLDDFVLDILAYADQEADTTIASKGVSWTTALWTWSLFVVMVLSSTMLLSRAAREAVRP